MGRLRHRTAPGCTYFVTTDAWQKRSIFQVREVAEIVVGRLIECRDQGAYLLHEFVLMPDHLHLLITPGESTTLERAMQLIKGGSSREIHLKRGHKMKIWQPGFHEWTVREGRDYETKLHYIRTNPVKRGLVESPELWPFGSVSGKFQLDLAPQGLKPTVS